MLTNPAFPGKVVVDADRPSSNQPFAGGVRESPALDVIVMICMVATEPCCLSLVSR